WIFPRKSAAAVAAHSTVRINDNFAASEPGVALWAADHEISGRIHQKLRVLAYHFGGQNSFDDFLNDKTANLRMLHIAGVLRGNDHARDSNGLAILVNYRHLRFGVPAAPAHFSALAKAGQFAA